MKHAFYTVPLLLAAAPVHAVSPSPTAFETLKSLVGNWEGTNARGRTVKVSFHLTAAGSVLVENWEMANGRSSMTVYHLDKADLMATHYCPIGNQPRLTLTDGPADRLSFAFKDATNLRTPSEEHEHSFWIAVAGPDAFTRSETYLGEDGPSTSELVFKRINARTP